MTFVLPLPNRHVFVLCCLCTALTAGLATANAIGSDEITAARQGTQIVVRGGHFRLQVDAAKGGEITSLDLFDGADWNRVLGRDGQTCPALVFVAPRTEYRHANDAAARIEKFDAAADRVAFDVLASPRDGAGRNSRWSVRLSYEIYTEGALFIDIDCHLPVAAENLSQANVSFIVDRAIVRGAKYRQEAVPALGDPAALETARVAWGTDPRVSFTNELQAIVEHKPSDTGAAAFHAAPGRFNWILRSTGFQPVKEPGQDGHATPPSPPPARLHFHNRLALALGSGAAGFRKSNLIGQRVYHWINYLDAGTPANWYPTDAEIDKMAANHATVLILHDRWMLHSGRNGDPHADYRSARDEQSLRQTVTRAHDKGLRVGLYCRGIERYALDARFFERYCRANWDGLYVDWDGPQCVANHEHNHRPDTALGDRHFSADGSCLPARDYFLYMRRLRRLVGPRGFLVGHQGFGAAGVLPNLVFDAYLPGEAPFDRRMFDTLDDAVYRGMMGAGPCNPWTLDSPAFVTPQAVAKMAAWGFSPHVGLGMKRPCDGFLFPRDPDDRANSFALPYWRLLSSIDTTRAEVFNLPNQKPPAANCDNPDFRALVYRASDKSYLVIVANLSSRTARTTLSLSAKVLGLSGRYTIERIDAQTGAATPLPNASTARLETTDLAPWQLEAFRLTPLSPAR